MFRAFYHANFTFFQSLFCRPTTLSRQNICIIQYFFVPLQSMENEKQHIGEEKQHIGQLFDRIAGTYDGLNHLLSLNIDKRWRRKAVGKLAEVRNQKSEISLLDVAIGTADLTIELLRQNKAAHVTGIDLSRQMMAIGQKKVAQSALRLWQRTTDALCQRVIRYCDLCLRCAELCQYGRRSKRDVSRIAAWWRTDDSGILLPHQPIDTLWV